MSSLDDQENLPESLRLESDDITKNYGGSEDKPFESRPLTNSSTVVVLLIGFIGFIEYSVTMPSMFIYLKSLGGSYFLYGLALGGFSAVRVVFMPIFGRWSDVTALRIPFLTTILMNICASVVYALAQVFNSYWMILIGRFTLGIGAANNVLVTAYLTKCSTKEVRTQHLALSGMVNLVGIVIGPATNVIIKAMGNHTFDIAGYEIIYDTNTGPGWLVAALNILLFLSLFIFFREPPPQPTATSPLGKRRSSAVLVNFMMTWSIWDKWVYYCKERCVWILLLIAFNTEFLMSMVETVIAPLTKHAYDFDSLDNSYLFCGVAVIAAASTIFVAVKQKSILDRSFLWWGNLFVLVSSGFSFIFWRTDKPAFWALCVACGLQMTGIPMLRSASTGCYSKMLVGDFGIFLSIRAITGGIARSLGPLYGAMMFNVGLNMKNLSVILYAIVAVVVLSLLLLFWKWKYLDPQYHEDRVLQGKIHSDQDNEKPLLSTVS